MRISGTEARRRARSLFSGRNLAQQAGVRVVLNCGCDYKSLRIKYEIGRGIYLLMVVCLVNTENKPASLSEPRTVYSFISPARFCIMKLPAVSAGMTKKPSSEYISLAASPGNAERPSIPAALVQSSTPDFELVEKVFHLPIFVKARHSRACYQFLVLLVIPRADEKHVVGVNDNAVLKPPDGHQLVLVG